MTDYKRRLYEFCELRRRSPNRKLLRAWIDYIERNNIREGTCYNETLDFMANDPIVCDKTKSTKKRYNSELNKFNEYVYQQEGWILPWEKVEEKDESMISKKEGRSKWQDILNNAQANTKSYSDDCTDEIDEEYNEFLKKYEKLCGDGR